MSGDGESGELGWMKSMGGLPNASMSLDFMMKLAGSQRRAL